MGAVGVTWVFRVSASDRIPDWMSSSVSREREGKGEGRATSAGPRAPPTTWGGRCAASEGASVTTTGSGDDGDTWGAARFRRSFRNTVDKTFVKSPGLEPDLKIVIMLVLGDVGSGRCSGVAMGSRGRVPKRFLFGKTTGAA